MLDKSGIYPGYIWDISRIYTVILDISEIYNRIYPKYIWDTFSDLSGIPRLVGKEFFFHFYHRRTTRGIQKDGKRPQAAIPVGGPLQKCP
jgi:hypothetical protein